MIAHRIERKKGKDKFGRLACYILDVDTERDPRVFERLASYMVDRKFEGDRVVGTRITNCASDDFEWAVQEVQATQALNTRARGDKSYHLVFSFPAGERPTLEQLCDIEDQLVVAIGLSEHQRISAIHDDTDNLHVHVAINKVHPTTLRCIEPHYDKQKLMAACIELEQKHGLVQVNHGVKAEKKRSQAQEKMKAHAGRETLGGWVDENAKAPLIEALAAVKSWQDLHKAFAVQGLEIRPYGAGLVIGVPGQRATVKASDLGREFSVKSLTAKLGPYVKPGPEIAQVEPTRRYTRAPRQKSPEAQALFAQYKAERDAALAARAAGRIELESAHREYAAQLRQHHTKRVAGIRAESRIPGPERKVMFAQLAKERQSDWAAKRALMREQRSQLDAQHPLLTWSAFLEREASSGNEIALEALRAQSSYRSRVAADVLTAPDVAAARTVIDRNHKVTARKNGDMHYQVQDGGRLTDRATDIRMDQLSTGAAFLALSLASTRFGDQALLIEGSDEFRAEVVKVASLPGLNVRFADQALEEARLIAVKERERQDAARPAPGSAREYVSERNRQRDRFADILTHRIWAQAEVGEFAYAGRRAFPDGSEAILLRRDDELLVKISTDAQVAKASRWPRGKTVQIDAQGRFRQGPGRGVARGAS